MADGVVRYPDRVDAEQAFRFAHAAWVLVIVPGAKVRMWSGSRDWYRGVPRAAIYCGPGSVRLTVLAASFVVQWRARKVGGGNG